MAVINNFGGFYPTWVYFNEVRRQGGNIHLPCVNRSEYKTSIHGTDIFIGFIHLLGLERKAITRLISEREKNGDFADLEAFIRRTGLGIEQLILLIRSGAFRFTGKNKPELLWEVHLLVKAGKKQPEGKMLFQTGQIGRAHV